MKKEDFFEVLGELDDDIVKGAKTSMKKKINWRVWGTIAACFCLVAVLVFVSNNNLSPKNPDGDEVPTQSGETVNKEQQSVIRLSLTKPSSMTSGAVYDYDIETNPNVKLYQVEQDFSNIINIEDYSYFKDEIKQKLLENGFVVTNSGDYEFFSQYEANRYAMTPNFITTDSMLHTYHLYFSHLLKNIEQHYLYDELKTVCEEMITASKEQYELLSGTTWENAAKRNMAYFTVALKLLDDSVQPDPLVADIVGQELKLISDASQITVSPLMSWENSSDRPLEEDYSQYIVRGYYEENETLSQYFKVMMWFGRLTFRQSNDEETKSAVLMTSAMTNCGAAESWNKIYDVTTFFMGASDDPGVYEYASVLEEVYKNADLTVLTADTDKWVEFKEKLSELEPPLINSVPIYESETGEERDAQIEGFRFMGQRQTFDAVAMQKLVYQAVTENSEGEKRMLPSAMDIPAVFGSSEAEEILKEEGAFDFKNYGENLKKLQSTVADENDAAWKVSLYSNWMNTIRPLTEEKGEGYPFFMQNDAWTRKQLNTFLGSFTELKHDSVLYSKQVYAEMGGGGEEERDFRGYVEPHPKVYAGLAYLCALTREGLTEYHLISDKDSENLLRLEELSESLLTISNKELRSESLTDEEHDLIKTYGGQLEHFWYDALEDQFVDGYASPYEHPAAVVTDIATDPNGSVLEIGTGPVNTIYVIVDVEGSLRIAEGTVYSFYEFEQPLAERMTDKQWRIKLGLDYPEKPDGTPDFDAKQEKVEQPEWVNLFKINGER